MQLSLYVTDDIVALAFQAMAFSYTFIVDSELPTMPLRVRMLSQVSHGRKEYDPTHHL